jgi:hypothetical protein
MRFRASCGPLRLTEVSTPSVSAGVNTPESKKGKVNYEENKTHDGSAISLDRHSDGATG